MTQTPREIALSELGKLFNRIQNQEIIIEQGSGHIDKNGNIELEPLNVTPTKKIAPLVIEQYLENFFEALVSEIEMRITSRFLKHIQTRHLNE